MELNTSPGKGSFIVELSECLDFEVNILVELGFILMPLYWRSNDLPHTVGNLIILRRIEFQCVADHSADQGLAIVQKKMQMLADVTRKVSQGGSPSRFDPVKDGLASLNNGGQVTALGDSATFIRFRLGR